MRSKTLLSIIAFLIGFRNFGRCCTPRTAKPVSAPYARSSAATESETARKITNLLTQDIANGRVQRPHNKRLRRDGSFRVESNLPVSPRRLTLTPNASAGINDADLPRDFQTAWRRTYAGVAQTRGFIWMKCNTSPERIRRTSLCAENIRSKIKKFRILGMKF